MRLPKEIRLRTNGSQSGIGLPHSKTLARLIARVSFREVLECGSPTPLSLLPSAQAAPPLGLMPLYVGVAPLLTSATKSRMVTFAIIRWAAVGERVAVVIGALLLWYWTQALIGRKPAPTNGIGDLVHELTASWHGYFLANPRAANTALIISSVFIDIIGLSLIGSAIFGPTFAPFLAILIVFALRQLCQAFSTLPPPPGIIWRYPGFPALLVTYSVGNDFFFSGHTALAVLGAIEAANYGPTWLAIAAATIALGEVLIVLVLRAHYTLDVVAGALAAFLAADIAAKLAPVVDGWLR